jgi:uncharacterized protein YkwD
LILLVLLLVSCAPAVSEKDAEPVIREEKVTPAVEEKAAKEIEEGQSKETAGERGEEPESQEPPSPESELEKPQPQEPEPTEPDPQEPPPLNPEPQEPAPMPEEAEVPDHKYQELALFAVELINRDRAANGLATVELAGNTASQSHAEENLANGYSSHWGLDGSKPYMRYTLAGGVDYIGENVIGTGMSGDPSDARNPKQMLEQAHERFMDSPSHRANILNRWHKKISLGIAYDNDNFHLVQHFEGGFIRFSEFPNISSTILLTTGRAIVGNIEQINLHYDPLPEPLSPEELNAPPYDSSYSLGGIIGYVLAPPPNGFEYSDLSPLDVVATRWDIKTDGSFAIEADIGQMLGQGNGIYTVVVVVEINGELVQISNYSIFVQ